MKNGNITTSRKAITTTKITAPAEAPRHRYTGENDDIALVQSLYAGGEFTNLSNETADAELTLTLLVERPAPEDANEAEYEANIRLLERVQRCLTANHRALVAHWRWGVWNARAQA